MPSKMGIKSEAQLGRLVVAWFQGQHWEVYQEVQTRDGGPVADIVATHGPRLAVVECKVTLGLRVINQARRWAGSAHLVYVAVPWLRAGRDFTFACEVAARYGVGVLGVVPGMGDESVREIARPTLNRRAWAPELRRKLTDGHKTYAEAGNAEGRRWSPFRQTCAAVAAYAAQNPGVKLNELIKNIKTHYSSPATARVCIAKWAKLGKVPGIRLERAGRALLVWPSDEGKNNANL